MLTVDRNGIPIQEGDTLMYCCEKIPGAFFKSGEDLRPGDFVTVKFVDDDGTFNAIHRVHAGGGYFWFHGGKFEKEMVEKEMEFSPEDVDFF